MLTHGTHVFAPDTPVEDCARLAALMEALCAGRLVWDKPARVAVVHPGCTLVTDKAEGGRRKDESAGDVPLPPSSFRPQPFSTVVMCLQ